MSENPGLWRGKGKLDEMQASFAGAQGWRFKHGGNNSLDVGEKVQGTDMGT